MIAARHQPVPAGVVTRLAGVMCGLVLCSGTVNAAPPMQEGMWEITTQLDMPGMPMQMPAHTSRHCLTNKDMVPQQQQPGQQCKMLEQNVSGNTVTWRMECDTPQGKSTMHGRTTYTGNAMQGELRMRQGGTEMLQRISGKRVGDCR